jgi:hypothetical protein
MTGNTAPIVNVIPEKKKKKIYWTAETEEAVRVFLEMDTRFLTAKMKQYLENRKETYDSTIEDGTLAEFQDKIEWSMSEEVQDKKNRLYIKHLEKPLNRLVENIIYRYKLFRYDIDVRTAHNDCLGHIHDKFANFDPYKGHKSFSYFGTMAKNYCMNEIKKTHETKSRLLDYEDHKPEVDAKRLESLDEEGLPLEEMDIMFQLFHYIKSLLEEEIEKGEESKWTKNDITVSKALVYILTEHHKIGAYNKVDIYKEIAEETGLQRKDITYSLTRIRAFYRVKKQGFIKKKEEG